MEGESVRVGQSCTTKNPILDIHILVVDDDATSLAIVSAMLRTMRYGVVTVRNAIDALATLRMQKFDLVVTDLHMPEMNGIELQQRVAEEFKLPVIMMSADDEKSVIVESLQRGAAFYMVKPVRPDDLKHVWQYAVPGKKGKSVVIEEIRSIPEESSGEKVSYEGINSASATSAVNHEQQHGKKDPKRKTLKKGIENDHVGDQDNAAAPKKAKVVWTTSLHNRFLQAIRHIGLEKAVPKRIMEYMNVPGLTRENVASHLQKYRIFLKRVADKCGGTSKGLTDRSLRSSFAAGLPTLLMHNLNFPQHHGQQPIRTSSSSSFQPGVVLGGNTGSFNAPTLGPFLYSNKAAAAASATSLPPLGLNIGRWHNSSRNQANLNLLQQPLFGNINPLYPPNQPNMNILGSNYPTIGAHSIQTCPNSSYAKGNYAGIELSSGGELVVKGPSAGFNGTFVENHDVNNISALEKYWATANSGYMAQGGSSSANQLWSPGGFNTVNNYDQHEQDDFLTIPPLQPQQPYGGAKVGDQSDCCDDDDLLLINNISSLLDGIPPVEQSDEDDHLISDLFLEQDDNQTPDDGYEAEVNPTAIEEVLQNPASACVEETNIAPSSEPSFVKGNDNEHGVSDELFRMMYEVENGPPEDNLFPNQEWEDEFMNSIIFGNGPDPKE